MLIQWKPGGLTIRTPAKVNLFLEVLGKRADGYHEIDTLMCPVSLTDVLDIQYGDQPDRDRKHRDQQGSEQQNNNQPAIDFSIQHPGNGSFEEGSGTECTSIPEAASISVGNTNRRSATAEHACLASITKTETADGDPAWQIPADQNNLVVRALLAVSRAVGRGGKWQVTLRKQIPAAAGLGGGSSDAAAAIVGGLILCGTWNRELAQQIASSLGSDIPFFLGDKEHGFGLARGTGRGERIEMLAGRPPLNLVITHPAAGCSTAEVYRRWQPEGVPRGADRFQELINSTLTCPTETFRNDSTTRADIDFEAYARELVNALQPPARLVTQWVDKQLSGFARLGQPALMSGSGSACFALVRDAGHGKLIAQKMIELGLPRAYVVSAWYAPSIEQQLERNYQTRQEIV